MTEAILMLVSAEVGDDLRAEVAAGLRPCPEYLRLEQSYDVQLLDWTALGHGHGHRSAAQSIRHVATALSGLRLRDAVLTDGEHIGIPLAMSMRALRIDTPHMTIGHNLVTRSKAPFFRWGQAQRRMDRIIVHSANQVDVVTRELQVARSRLRVVPYGIDTSFWCPQPAAEEELVVAAGREHRDYACLVEACTEVRQVFITDGSAHSPNARRREPYTWPENVERRGLGWTELRSLYARAAVVVVPVVPSDVPFGVTAVLEAMSMGKAVVMSGTAGLLGVIVHGETGLVVPPGDVLALRAAVHHLLEHPDERRRLGEAARRTALKRFGLDEYVGRLAAQLGELTSGEPASVPPGP